MKLFWNMARFFALFCIALSCTAHGQIKGRPTLINKFEFSNDTNFYIVAPTYDPIRATVKVASSVELECLDIEKPTWLRNGKPIVGSYRYTISGKKLKIAYAIPSEDEGIYTVAELTACSPLDLRIALDGSVSGFINQSSRARISSSGGVVIMGMVLAGSDEKTVLVRAIGPSLSMFGISDGLRSPALGIYDSKGVLLISGFRNRAEIGHAPFAEKAGAFPLPTESNDVSAVVKLSPGAYTAVVTGLEGDTGELLVEAYEVH